jgi:hypothetical protein
MLALARRRVPEGEPYIAASYRHQLGDYLRPALSLGLQVRRCEEPRAVPSASRPPEPAAGIGDWPDWPRSAGQRQLGPPPKLISLPSASR